MAATSMLSGSSLYERRVVSHVRTYNWPPIALNIWIFFMLLAATSIMGVFSVFIQIQNQLELPIPWCAGLPGSAGDRFANRLLAGTSPTTSPSARSPSSSSSASSS